MGTGVARKGLAPVARFGIAARVTRPLARPVCCNTALLVCRTRISACADKGIYHVISSLQERGGHVMHSKDSNDAALPEQRPATHSLCRQENSTFGTGGSNLKSRCHQRSISI